MSHDRTTDAQQDDSTHRSADMTAQKRRRLLAEAQLLAELLKQHVQDRQMAREDTRRHIYFVDAHELKIYLNASSRPEYMRGFILDFEQTILDDGDPSWQHLENYLRLKSEQMLHWLLFDYSHPVVVLPSHSAEIDDEIGYRTHHLLLEELGLMKTADIELRRLRESHVASRLLPSLLEKAEHDHEARVQVLSYLEAYAPAVSAFIRRDPDTMKTRIEALLYKSNIISMKDVPWEHFGLSDLACAAIRESTVDEALSYRWQETLSKERSNSYQANRLDGEAISHLTVINQILGRHNEPFHAVLVTRAMTLFGLVHRDGLSDQIRHASKLLRHSRLSILSPEENLTDASDERISDALSQLQVALSTYVARLKVSETTPVNWIHEAGNVVEAWHRFEASRHTVELAESTAVEVEKRLDGPSADAMRQVLHWLRSEEQLLPAVVERLNDGVVRFNQKVFHADDEASDERFKALIFATAKGFRLQPISAQIIGPFEFTLSAFDGYFEGCIQRGVSTVLVPSAIGASRDIAEQYFIRALRHACAGKPQMASVYADGAYRSAELLSNRALKDEAALLLAQSVRAEISLRDWDRDEEERRVRRARHTLSQCKAWNRDARFTLEASSLRLEALLRFPSWAHLGTQLGEGLKELEDAQRLARSADDRLRVAELALLYLIAMNERPGTVVDDLRPHVQAWHATVVEGLDTLRRSTETTLEVDVIRPRLRGVEIAGYDLLATAVPSDFQIDLHDLQGILGRSVERSSKALTAMLQRVSYRTDTAREYNLAFAPVWSQAETATLFSREIADQHARVSALKASAIIHAIGERCGLGAGDEDRRDLAHARELFDDALARIDRRQVDPMALFHLRMEHAYGRLLDCSLESNLDSRAELYNSLCIDYEAMLAEHPNVAVLHFRYGIVLDGLDRHDEAFAAIKRAMQALSADTYIKQDHWLSSTIVRRLAYFFANRAREVSERMKAEPSNEVLAMQYRSHVRDAFVTIAAGFGERIVPMGLLASLESQRRLNNIVYYAALYLDAGGDLSELEDGFDADRLVGHVRQLHPHGIRRVTEWNVLHTIGYAYHVVGRYEEAGEAADALWNLISKIGTSTQSVGIRNALDDALVWKKNAAQFGRPTTY